MRGLHECNQILKIQGGNGGWGGAGIRKIPSKRGKEENLSSSGESESQPRISYSVKPKRKKKQDHRERGLIRRQRKKTEKKAPSNKKRKKRGREKKVSLIVIGLSKNAVCWQRARLIANVKGFVCGAEEEDPK